MADETTSAALPVDAAEFAAALEPLGPFEAGPTLAVGVSGGADSLALCLLADRWARARGGHVAALSVDHGLRPQSAAEIRHVAGWLAARGISHRILHWLGDKPATGIQAAARKARYALMHDWCAANGILHLLLAHHQDDQAETLLLRLARGSGVDGLSAMRPVTAFQRIRLLRPLLDIPHGRLVATLAAENQAWIEDPSNASERYRRARLRRMMPALSREGLSGPRLAATAHRLARARAALDGFTDDLLVRTVVLDHRGFARVSPSAILAAPEEIALRAMARLFRTIGGADYPPRLERLERLMREWRGDLAGRRTFCGCLIVAKAGGVLVCREPARVGDPVPVRGGVRILWDNRFSLSLAGAGEGMVGALGHRGWLSVRDAVGKPSLPTEILSTLPALSDQHGISSVPHLGYERNGRSALCIAHVCFTPANPLTLA